MKEDFKIDSRVFLEKAKNLIANNSKQDLFYAALNLRFGIEYRIKQYEHAMKDYLMKKSKKNASVAEIHKGIEKAFQLGNKIVKVSFSLKSKEEIICTLYHTPVTPKLNSLHGKLGRYLHMNVSNKYYEKKSWEVFTNFLNEVCKELENTLKGNLLSPPIKNNLQVNFTTDDTDNANLLKFYFDKGFKDIFIKVEYLNQNDISKIM